MNNIISKKGEGFIEVQLGVLVFQEESSYIAYCPALNLSTYGDSINDVKEAFDDVVQCYIDDNTRMGTLEKDLREHGWEMQISSGKAEPPKQIDLIDLDIPSAMLRQQFNEPFRIPVPAA
jgi:hypothetical protein